MTRLDDFFAQHADLAKTPVSLIKIDVQGAELIVLRGMHQTLRTNNYPPILVEYSPDDLKHAGVTPGEFFSASKRWIPPATLPDLSPRTRTEGSATRRRLPDLAMIRTRFLKTRVSQNTSR
jgi:hypothetical protein